MKKYEVEFCGGESRDYSHKAANFLYVTVYDKAEEDINPACLKFWWD